MSTHAKEFSVLRSSKPLSCRLFFPLGAHHALKWKVCQPFPPGCLPGVPICPLQVSLISDTLSMPTLGAGLASWNNIDDSRWIIYRTRVADLPLDSPSHELGVILSYIACPPPEGKRSKGTVLLIHGFPQTNYQYRRVITPIADAGYTVIAPDNRGIGQSSKPINGYTKASLAQDLHTLLEEIGVTDKVHVVGHGTGERNMGPLRSSCADAAT